MTEQPETFYRYRAFDTLTLDSLCSDVLYFAHPATFNDPFDCNPTLQCDSDISELKELLSEMIKRRVADETKKSLKSLRLEGQKAIELATRRATAEAANKLGYLRYMASDPDYSESPEVVETGLLTQAVEEELRSHYARGICCFSTSYSNPLLWSHYGDQHRGLCIGYGKDRLPKPNFQKVDYGTNRALSTSLLHRAFIENEQQANHDLDHDFLLRKAEDWSYEDEWRLIGKQGLQESPLLLTEVTFGLRCPLPVMHSIVQALTGRKSLVHFYVIREAPHSYALSRVELDTDEMAAMLPRMATSAIEEFGLEDEL